MPTPFVVGRVVGRGIQAVRVLEPAAPAPWTVLYTLEHTGGFVEFPGSETSVVRVVVRADRRRAARRRTRHQDLPQ